MKKLIFAAVLWLFAASQFFAQNSALQLRATGTGNTTGNIANLTVFNPGSTPQTLALPPCYIPATGGYQPYVVPGSTTVVVHPGSTANVPIQGYCTDVHLPPVPSGLAMAPVSSWLQAEQNSTAATLLDAILKISSAFDRMKNDGQITTPFSGNPEKEREAVIQQTFWIYTAALTGKEYKIEDFSSNTIRQFETVSGQEFQTAPNATQQNIEQGVTDFWNTFQAVGIEAKVLQNGSKSAGTPVEISVKDDYCDCGQVTLTAKVFIKDPFRPEEACKDLQLDGGTDARDTIEYNVIPNHEVRLDITDLVTKCTECNTGPCIAENVAVNISSKGLTENKAENIAAVSGKYSLPAKMVASLGKDKNDKDLKPAEHPVRFYITVKYDCVKAPCKKKSCEKVFEVTVPRK